MAALLPVWGGQPAPTAPKTKPGAWEEKTPFDNAFTAFPCTEIVRQIELGQMTSLTALDSSQSKFSTTHIVFRPWARWPILIVFETLKRSSATRS